MFPKQTLARQLAPSLGGEAAGAAPDNFPVLLGNKLLFWGNSEQVCQVHRDPRGAAGGNALSESPLQPFEKESGSFFFFFKEF